MCGPHAAPFPVGHKPDSRRNPARALIPCTARSPRDTHPKARACYPDIGTANARVRLPGRNGSWATVFIGDRCPLEGQSSLDLGMVCLMGKHPDSCDCVLAARVMLPCFPNIIGLCTLSPSLLPSVKIRFFFSRWFGLRLEEIGLALTIFSVIGDRNNCRKPTQHFFIKLHKRKPPNLFGCFNNDDYNCYFCTIVAPVHEILFCLRSMCSTKSVWKNKVITLWFF